MRCWRPAAGCSRQCCCLRAARHPHTAPSCNRPRCSPCWWRGTRRRPCT
ncbi:hypothetical protein HaLaN_05900, partial [Haematococcus lacustris]